MCMMMDVPHLTAIVPASVLLTISFFVLLAGRKLESTGLKAFGYLIAILLWISAAIVLTFGVDMMKSYHRGMMPMKWEKVKHKMDEPGAYPLKTDNKMMDKTMPGHGGNEKAK